MPITINGSGTATGVNPGGLQDGAGPVLMTAQASTSGTAIDFTGIPSWAKRVTVMFNGVSTNGSSNYLVQVGSGSFVTSGYASNAASVGGGGYNATASTAGFLIVNGDGATTNCAVGQMFLTLSGSNVWIGCHNVSSVTTLGGGSRPGHGAGNITLSGTLDRIRITTTSGTDTFDAGSINVMYE